MSAIVYREPYKLPAGILAVAVHGAFFALLYFGFAWQTQPSGTMSVELWQSLPDTIDAPPAQAKVDEAVPPPEKVIEPKAPQPEKMAEPEIVLPDKKKVEPDKRKTEIKPAKPDKKKLAKSSAEGVESKSAGQGTGSSIADQAARERGERVAAIGRMVDEHIDKIKNKIRRNIVMPPDVAEDARTEFLVTVLPGGSVLPPRLLKSSGNAAYDDAVERAILKSQPLPLPADAALFNKFREMRLGFKPKE